MFLQIPEAATSALRRSPRPCATAIQSISDLCARNRAWFAPSSLLTRIICRLPSRVPSGGRSAINTRCHYAVRTIAKHIGRLKRLGGGNRLVLHRSRWRRRFGKRANRATLSPRRMNRWQKTPRGGAAASSTAALMQWKSQPRGEQSIGDAMTSLKQITANRINALKSTGPQSEQGKPPVA